MSGREFRECRREDLTTGPRISRTRFNGPRQVVLKARPVINYRRRRRRRRSRNLGLFCGARHPGGDAFKTTAGARINYYYGTIRVNYSDCLRTLFEYERYRPGP